MFGRAFVAAGALHGLSEGAAQALGHVALSCTQSLRAPASAGRDGAAARAALARAGTTLPRPLLNVCVVGDSGVGKSSLVYAYAGRAERPEPTPKADFAYVDSRRRGVDASFAVSRPGARCRDRLRLRRSRMPGAGTAEAMRGSPTAPRTRAHRSGTWARAKKRVSSAVAHFSPWRVPSCWFTTPPGSTPPAASTTGLSRSRSR